MRIKLTTVAISCFFCSFNAVSQTADSTDRFRLYPLETVQNKVIFSDGEVFSSKSDRSSFLISDETLRQCLVTVNLIEYRAGKKISEVRVFSKSAIYDNPLLQQFEDSSMVFSLYRKRISKNDFVWGFRLPTAFDTRKIRLHTKESLYSVVAIPQNFLNNKVPIGTPFPLLVITSPDKSGNFNFFRPENTTRYPVSEWNNRYNLDHTFVVELTLEKPDARSFSYSN